MLTRMTGLFPQVFSQPRRGTGSGRFWLLLFSLVLCLPARVWAAGDEIIWTRDCGGQGEQTAYALRTTADGGYVVAGSSSTADGLLDMYCLHTDALGNPLWEKTWGGEGNQTAGAVEQLADGSYLLAGSSTATDSGKSAIYIAKTDRAGNLLWDKVLPSSASKTAILATIKTSDNAVIITGYMQNAYGLKQGYLSKIDANGKVVWENSLAATEAEELRGIALAKDGGYILCGYTEKPGSAERDMLLIKTDASGNLKWRRAMGGSGLQTANSIIAAADGTYLLTGYKTGSSASNTSTCVRKTDANGSILWDKSYASGNESAGFAIQASADGNYMVFCTSRSEITNVSGAYLLRIDGQGNKVADLNLGQAGPEMLAGGLAMSDGAGIVVGSKNSGDQGRNVCLAKVKFLTRTAAVPVVTKGSLNWPDQSEYRGDLQNGKANGWGKVSYSDGGSYEGEWRDNLFNGQGTLITPDGSKYKGGFKDNMYFGKGVYTWPGGERYEGDYRYNKRNGEGTFIWPGGIKYSGEWLDNQAQGYGSITWPNREAYSGEMNAGQATGMGSYTFSNGEKYTGQFSSLNFEGLGTYSWPNGARYIGEFKSDMMNGQGTYIWPSGVQQWGYWKDDKYIGLYPTGFSKKDK